VAVFRRHGDTSGWSKGLTYDNPLAISSLRLSDRGIDDVATFHRPPCRRTEGPFSQESFVAMATLRAATESCIRDFAVVCHELEQHAYLETSWCEDIQEAFGRFRVWTGNLGALAKGHSALDWRLRDADVMRSTVLSLLVELQNTLELGM
jgi:hypothetical protein